MRHAPFVIGLAEREAWLGHMTDAVEAADTGEEERGELIEYFTMASRNLINSR
jgi:hemoglobin